MSQPLDASTERPFTAVAAMLSWILPGLGHWWLGHRVRAAIFFVVISVTFWAGVAVGGVRTTVSPKENGAWIAAQLCVGPQALVALYMNHRAVERADQESLKAIWPASNVSVVYAGVAGLLNLLIIIDSMSRCESLRGPLPVRASPRKGGG